MSAGAFKAVVSAVRGDGAPSMTAGFLHPIDTNRVAANLDIDKLATENGRRDFPPTESDRLDSVEQSILQKIESEWTLHGGELINHLRAYASRLIGYSVDAEFERLQLKANVALTNLRSAHHRAEADLGHLQKEFTEARDEFASFRSRHRLHRPVRNPSGRWTSVGLLVVLIALESVLNGFFFAKGSEFGLVGGIGTAVGISICNVAFAFVLGLGPFRWANHRNILIKLSGFLMSIGGLAAIIALHAFAAHLRDATAAVGEERAMTVAIESMLRTPWAVADHLSVYLFVLGTLFGLLAIWKGYAFDDPYPQYGAHARRADAARQAYGDAHADTFDALEDIKQDTVRELDNGISRIPLFPQQTAQIRAQRTATLQTFRAHEAAIVTAANQLLTRYRDKNREHRTTVVPSYFARPWQLPHSLLESARINELTAEPNIPTSDTAVMLAELRALAKEVLSEYESLMTKYPHTSQMA